MRERRHIEVRGTVQGVGFRPFVYGLARRHALAGHVYNDAAGVTIEVEGESASLEAFLNEVQADSPPLSAILELDFASVPTLGEREFVIEASHGAAAKNALISPDVCVCPDCLREMHDPADRRYRYPFINCTNCGPRFTIIRDVPYDRPLTTMAAFPMCEDCRREYHEPANRRFHAQPNACPVCGPRARFEGPAGETAEGACAVELAARALAAGQIVAVKGLGGYHLACDARSPAAVARLRARKRRFEKPFALMVPDLATAETLCETSGPEAEALTARQRPIVLLRARPSHLVTPEVAPRENTLGVMLPYTPLHFLLLAAFQGAIGAGELAVLVMTSGNLSDEPIAYQDEDARSRLSGLADAFLTHNREIHMRCDDSVVRVVAGRKLLVRRSRGFAPAPVPLPRELPIPLLAVGAHLKNTFCLAKGRHAFVSHHIGDLENLETLTSFREGIAHFERLFDVTPEAVAYDLHPEYLATKHALDLAEARPELRLIGVQHHHAHIAAVTGENGVAEPVIGVAFDGTGYGTDGTLWGGEFLVADWRGFERVGHLEALPLLGGERAIQEIWRLAAAWLERVYGAPFLELDLPFVKRLNREKWSVLCRMAAHNLNAPLSSAMGRTFDAVAALIGLREAVTCEAQAAIELEMLADATVFDAYPFEIGSGQPRVLTLDGTARGIVTDLASGVAAATIAAKFHNTVAHATVAMCEAVHSDRPHLTQVALGGGVFQNPLLLERTFAGLENAGFTVLMPRALPFNDGAIAYGQVVVASARLQRDVLAAAG